MLSSTLIGCFIVPLISKKETQGGKYIFKYFLTYRRVIILYINRGHQGAVINTQSIETAFERSVDRAIVSLSRDAMYKKHVPLVARVILLERIICFPCLSE